MPIVFEARVRTKWSEIETLWNIADSGEGNKRHRVSTSALGKSSSAEQPLSPQEPTGRMAAGAAYEVGVFVHSSVRGGNAQSPRATIRDQGGASSTESVQKALLGG